MRTERGLDRLVFFTDAVSAIAITLLILPLVDSASQAAERHAGVASFVSDSGDQLVGFALSFVVIARLWAVHHSMFEHVVAYNKNLLLISLFWSLTIAFLPLPTEMASRFPTSPTTVFWYVGTMLLSSAALLLLAITIRRSPDLAPPNSPMPAHSVVAIGAITLTFLAALIVGVLIPAVGFFALFLVFLAAPGAKLWERMTPGPAASEPES